MENIEHKTCLKWMPRRHRLTSVFHKKEFPLYLKLTYHEGNSVVD